MGIANFIAFRLLPISLLRNFDTTENGNVHLIIPVMNLMHYCAVVDAM